jgi:polyhydroxyalkanoate synthase subunit PhaC
LGDAVTTTDRGRRQGSDGRSRERTRRAPSVDGSRADENGAGGADGPAGTDAVEGAEAVGVPTATGVVGGLLSVLAQPRAAVREAVHLGRDGVRIMWGTDHPAPPPKDRRFRDAAWTSNPGYRRLGQGYLSVAGSMSRLVDEYEASGADWRKVERARFVVNAMTSGMAPTNTLLGNPAALKRAFDTGGRSVLRGMGHMLHDLRHNGGLPTQVDRGAFTVGADLAVTPGTVVHRDEVAELIQYTPTTPDVHRRPLVIVPPPIGRYYFLDLRPGRSFVEFAVSQGLTVFMISWRNPTKEQADWDLDVYARATLDAVDVAREITGSPDVNGLGFCAGGVVLATALNHLAATDDDRVHSAGFAVTLLDFGGRAPIGAFSGGRLLSLARGNSRRQGVITARQMGSVFTWMRPDDLIFNYVVNQWLMGEDPPAFDILAWNADGTNLPARLHSQFLDIFGTNSLVDPGAIQVLGSPVDLRRISVPTFVAGAVGDHLTPWKGCYRTTQLLAGPSTFVLSNAGHIQSLVNPPGNPKASYYAGGDPGAEPETWLATAERHTGTWWEPWAEWVRLRSGEEMPAPRSPGSGAHPPLAAAPGAYVRDRRPA